MSLLLAQKLDALDPDVKQGLMRQAAADHTNAILERLGKEIRAARDLGLAGDATELSKASQLAAIAWFILNLDEDRRMYVGN